MYENLTVPNKLRVSRASKSHCGVSIKSDSVTRQDFLKMSKITSILEKYRRTGLCEQVCRPAIPLDRQLAPELSDLQTLHNYVCELRGMPEFGIHPPEAGVASEKAAESAPASIEGSQNPPSVTGSETPSVAGGN